MTFRRTRLALAILSTVLTGCAGPDAPPTAGAPAQETGPRAGGVEIRDARAQLMPQMGGVYLTVVNGGAEDDRLVSATTPIATAAELHESFEEDGVIRMRARPEGFAVPAGGRLELLPRGKHMMLIEPLAPGDGETTFPLTLTFQKAGDVEVEVTVIPIGQMSP